MLEEQLIHMLYMHFSKKLDIILPCRDAYTFAKKHRYDNAEWLKPLVDKNILYVYKEAQEQFSFYVNNIHHDIPNIQDDYYKLTPIELREKFCIMHEHYNHLLASLDSINTVLSYASFKGFLDGIVDAPCALEKTVQPLLMQTVDLIYTIKYSLPLSHVSSESIENVYTLLSDFRKNELFLLIFLNLLQMKNGQGGSGKKIFLP